MDLYFNASSLAVGQSTFSRRLVLLKNSDMGRDGAEPLSFVLDNEHLLSVLSRQFRFFLVLFLEVFFLGFFF